MLDRARRDTTHPQVRYVRHDLDQLELERGAFDLAYSSLTFHYLADLALLFQTAAAAVAPGGGFVFSV